jgi:flagellar biosynthesis protein FlhF
MGQAVCEKNATSRQREFGNAMTQLRTFVAKEARQPRDAIGRAELLSLLRSHRAPDAVTHDLAKAAAESGLSDPSLALACALDRRMKAMPIDVTQNAALLLVGSHGSGKTAVAAKLAAHARYASRSVSLICTGTSVAGAIPRAEALAREIDVPFAVAEGAEGLAKLTAECRKTNTVAVIDTAGFDLRNGKARSAFSALAQIESVEAIGVASATADAEETIETVGALASLGAQRLVVTGVDLTARLGALVAAATGGTPLAHITCSAYVAAGLETVTPLSLARALIGSCGDADTGSAH